MHLCVYNYNVCEGKWKVVGLALLYTVVLPPVIANQYSYKNNQIWENCYYFYISKILILCKV